ncbi:MAG: gliding motility-associated C-terminal domain-containing protein [Bacteroidota bacterium]|nr:gliding motility-associated C-terminal domain-containing protein [Bacteroidota bacterium]
MRCKGEEDVVLLPGFEVKAGAEFQAHLAPCGENCPDPVANVGENKYVTLCPPAYGIPLGTAGVFGMQYQWVSDPVGYAQPPYLSDPYSPTPVFEAPPSGSGTIKYTLLVTNCDGVTAVDEIIINYDRTPTTNPFVAINSTNTNIGDYVELDLSVGNKTEEVIIEVLDALGNPVLNAQGQPIVYSLIVGQDFQCCNFVYDLPDYLDPCVDHIIRVKARNFCNQTWAIQTTVWRPNRNPVALFISNVMTLNGDGINDLWCFQASGATTYSVDITSRSNFIIRNYSGTVQGDKFVCPWDGTYPNGNVVPTGTYYYNLTLSNHCNQLSINEVGTIAILYRVSSEHEIDTNQFAFKEPALLISPNPFTTQTVFRYKLEYPQAVTLQVYTPEGKIVASLANQWQLEGEQQIILEGMNLTSGVYVYQLMFADKTLRGKLIKF